MLKLFTFKPTIKKTVTKATSIKGIIVLKDTYYVKTKDNICYPIADASYNCKNYERVYDGVDSKGHRIAIIRNPLEALAAPGYTPFGVNHEVEGKLINGFVHISKIHGNKKIFLIES